MVEIDLETRASPSYAIGGIEYWLNDIEDVTYQKRIKKCREILEKLRQARNEYYEQ